jgi:hypothetical protein
MRSSIWNQKSNKKMERRSFLRSLVGGVAVAAAVRTFPFRVFSFPSEIHLCPIMYGNLKVVTQPLYDVELWWWSLRNRSPAFDGNAIEPGSMKIIDLEPEEQG